MEYLFMIALVGLIIFKAVTGNSRAKKEETGRTTLPGKRSTAILEEKKKARPVESWEEWFAGGSSEIKIPVQMEISTSYEPIEMNASENDKKNNDTSIKPANPFTKSVRLDSKENIRRAIIYSEIMNRKY